MPATSRRTRQIIQSYEARSLRKRPWVIKLADRLTAFYGSLTFLTLNGLFFVGWVVWNSGFIPGLPIYDPYPFIFLTMTVSLEAIFLSIVVLMSQSRQSIISSHRDELQLQVNLLTERELTKVLKLLISINDHLKIKRTEDPELESMLKDLDTSYIERKLEDQLKPDHPPLFPVVTKPLEMITHAVASTIAVEIPTKNGTKEKK